MDAANPKTLIEAVAHFSSPEVCHRYMLSLKWPDGNIRCPKCGGEKVGEIKTRRMLECRNPECGKQFSAKVGTIFEDSKLPLSKCFVAVWMVANCKNGVSSLELSRAVGITQKSAWFLLHRIRLAMKTETFRKMSGDVESDETFVGGRAANMHKSRRERTITGRGTVGKSIVHGLLERGGLGMTSQVRASVVGSTEAERLLPEVRANVAPGSNVYTDAHASYRDLIGQYVHKWIDHAAAYVVGRIHVNGLENFWSLLKRTLRGTYVAVAPFHLFRYVDEQAWRFNQRELNDGERFAAVMKRVLGKRLTFRELCAIDDAGFMGIT